MAKAQAEPAVEGAAPAPLVPASYKLVGIAEGVTHVHIPQLNKEYDLDELTSRLDVLELLHRLGNPHVEKIG